MAIDKKRLDKALKGAGLTSEQVNKVHEELGLNEAADTDAPRQRGGHGAARIESPLFDF